MVVKVTDAELIAAWKKCKGSPRRVAEETGLTERAVYDRRRRMEKTGRGVLETKFTPGSRPPTDEWADMGWTFPRERRIDIADGTVVVASDAHFWPGEPSVAHRALLKVIPAVKPRLMVLNGDVFDGGKIGRHDPFGWSERPSAAQELEACIERVGEIELRLPKGCERVWNVGNHCIRFERNLAAKVPEYANLHGFRLEHHFPSWELVWSTLINADNPHPVMIKHRFASSGIHAAYNATLRAGLSTVSGHTHLLDVKSWGDYRGRRYGIQTGTLQDLSHPSFEYVENNPTAACSGFVVLTFNNGRLLHPEFCEVTDGQAWFRGRVVI